MTAAATPLAERQIDLLDELCEIGMTAARAIGRQITAIAPDHTPISPEAVATLEGLTRAYSKLARAIRLTVMLQDKIARPTGQASSEPAYQPITHIVRTIVDPRQDRSDADSTTHESRDRLDHETEQTPTDLITHICHDLGLDPDWSRRAADCWTHAESITAAPGWPLPNLTSDDQPAPRHPPPRSPSPLAGEGVSAADG